MRSPALRQARTTRRKSAVRTIVSIKHATSGARRRAASETVLRSRVGFLFDGLHVCLHRLERTVVSDHEILREARFTARGDVEHVIEHQYLAVGIWSSTDPDHRYLQGFGGFRAERGGNALQQNDIG